MITKFFFLQLSILLASFFWVQSTDIQTASLASSGCIIDVTFDSSVIAEQLCAQFAGPLEVAAVTCSADSKIDQKELLYLTGIEPGSTITHIQLLAACKAFQLKQKFKTVTITVHPLDVGVRLDFAFQSVWTFGKVTFSGLLLGKDRYKHLYALESGEPFDIEHHKELLEAIRNYFKEEGFFNGTVADYLEYQSDTKTVDVHIVLDHQEQFRVQDVEMTIHMPMGDDQENCQQMKQKLRSVVNTCVYHKRYTKMLVDQAGSVLRKHLAKRGYLEATIAMRECINYEKAAIKLEFDITLHDRREIEFFGNHHFTTNQLLEMIASFGRSAWLVPPEVLAQEFESAYRAKGFWHIHIETVTEQNRLIFVIREGSRARLLNVRLEGVTVDTVDQMAQKWFSRLLKQPYIDQDELQNQLSCLLAWYQHQGYWDARLLRQEFLSAGKPDAYELVLVIDEGAQRMLTSLSIEGHPELLDVGPFVGCVSKLPLPFDTALLHTQRLWLLNHFHELGYLQVRVTPHITYDGVLASVVWELENIEEPATFGKTIVVGRTRTQFEYIHRQLRYKEGQIWDQTALEDSLAALRHLNIFESLYVSPQASDESNNERTILLKLVEYDPFEIRFRVGFQQISKNFTFRSGSTYKIGGALLWRNPFKVGDYFCFDADVTKYFRNVSLRYYRPWLGQSPYQTQWKLYSNRYIQPVSKGCKEPLYEVLQQGFLIGLSRAFSRVDTGGNIGIEVMETGNLSPAMAQAIDFNQELRDRKVPLAFFEGSMLIDFLDDQVNPKRGSLTAISCKGMFPWKHHAVSFFKILFEQSCFYDPYHRLIIGAKIRFGYIFAKDFRSIMPPERFFLGGEHSLRSYWADFAPPLGKFIEDGQIVYVPRGGKSMVNACFEARFPIFRNLGGVIFQDIGMLAQSELAQLKGGRMLAATGFGFRYLTPIGPVRFDIGFKWRRDTPEEPRFAWFLTLGESF